MNKRELFKPGDPPQIFRREIKPLRKDEYPSEKEIASLTGEVGKSRIKEAIGLALVSSGLVGLTVGCAREIIEPTPPVEPTKVPTEVPTPTSRAEILPTPTVARIEIAPREIGGVTGKEMSVRFGGETQKLLKYTLDNGEAFFRLGLYPDLPNISESPDLVNEVVYYQDQPFVFLTTISPLVGHPEALPFYDRNVPEVGIVRWIRGEESISQQAAFEQLQEDEASVRFDSEKGIYEFLDEAGNVTRIKEVFKVPEPTPTPTEEPTPTPEIQRVTYLEDNFSGTNRAVFEGPNPRFENNALFFTFSKDGGWLWARTRIPMSNFRLEARLAGDGDYGLNFGGSRLEDINYDLILFRDGNLVLNLHQGDDFLGALLSKKVLSRSEVKGFHTFGLEYNGEKVVIFFDGEKVGEVSKDRLREGLEKAGGNGRIGLNCWDDGKENVEVGIDYLAVKLPQELIPTPTPVPPEPTETPRPPVCEIPHFIDRTLDRKTGYIIDFGEYYPEIYHPDSSPYAPYDNGARGMRMDIPGTSYDAWKWVREAVVVNIDKENQIIELYVGRGITVKRRFTQDTHVVMSAHEVYRGMPSSQARQWGGNFCDLEERDLVAILHPDFGEAVNLNPGLVDLWGVLIVQ